MPDTVKTLYAIAEERGTSVYLLCAAADINYNTIASARRRGTQLSIDTLVYLCRALQMPLSEFFAKAEGDAGACAEQNGGETGNGTPRS